MKRLRVLSAALFACFFAVAAALAADASPTGTWKWAVTRQSGGEVQLTLKLNYAAGKLSGTMLAPAGTNFPDTPISDASFDGNTVRFSVTREARGVTVTTKYEGKLEGDTIKGTSERPNVQGGGGAVKREWAAQRAKS